MEDEPIVNSNTNNAYESPTNAVQAVDIDKQVEMATPLKQLPEKISTNNRHEVKMSDHTESA